PRVAAAPEARTEVAGAAHVQQRRRDRPWSIEGEVSRVGSGGGKGAACSCEQNCDTDPARERLLARLRLALRRSGLVVGRRRSRPSEIVRIAIAVARQMRSLHAIRLACVAEAMTSELMRPHTSSADHVWCG